MQEIVRRIYDSKFDVESKEWEEFIYKVSKYLGVSIPLRATHPYVSYSLFFIEEKESIELNKLYKDAFISGNYNHEILHENIGDPLYKNDEIIELYSNYKSQGYSDLSGIQSDLKNDLKKINQLIYGVIQNVILHTSTEIPQSNGLFKSNYESNYLVQLLFNWSLKLMYKFSLEKHQSNVLSVLGKDLNELRENGAKIQYKINLIQKVNDQKKYNTDRQIDSYLKELISGNTLPHPKKIAETYYIDTNSKNRKYSVDTIAAVMKQTKEYLKENPDLNSIYGHINTIIKNCKNLKGGREAKSNWIKHYAKKAGLNTE